MRDIRLDDVAGILTIITASLTAAILVIFSEPAWHYIRLSTLWDPVSKTFGILAFLFGSIYVSLLSLALAAPIGILTAVYLVHYAPERVRQVYAMIVEALASVPSVVYGLRGLFVIGSVFGTEAFRANKLVASITLSVMLLPTIISLTRAALESVPQEIREAAYALGAMEHELSLLELSLLKPQILAAALMALMRAIGETMAVTMTIGNVASISVNPLDPGSTLTSLIATEFGGAMDPIHRSAIVFAALMLFIISMTIYALSRRVISHAEGV